MVLIGHYGATLVNKDANEDVTVQLQLDRAGVNPLVETGFWEVLYKDRNTVPRLGGSVLASAWCSVHERPLSAAIAGL